MEVKVWRIWGASGLQATVVGSGQWAVGSGQWAVGRAVFTELPLKLEIQVKELRSQLDSVYFAYFFLEKIKKVIL